MTLNRTILGTIAATILVLTFASDGARAGVLFEAPILKQFAGVSGGLSGDLYGGSSVADLNRDGIPDVATSGWGGEVQLLLGIGDGRLSQHLSLPARAIAPITGDFDLDGFTDIAWGGMDAGVYFGDGSAISWLSHSLDIGSRYIVGAAAGDIDADGSLDVVLIGHRQIIAFLSRPGRTFERVICLEDSIYVGTVWEIQERDLDRDGALDLVVAGDELNVFLGLGNGTFAHSIVPSANQGFDLADVTDDGILDLIVVTMGRLGFCIGNGDGSFDPPTVSNDPQETIFDVVVGDPDDDGVPDLIYSTSESFDGWGGMLITRVLHSIGDLGPPVELPIGDGLVGIDLVDMDRDERRDIVATLWTGGVGVALARSDGRFGVAVAEVSAEFGALRPVLGDLDGDGDLDLIAGHTNDGIQVFLTGPGRSFAPQPIVSLSGQPGHLACADVDGDGVLDVLASVYGPGVAVLRGNGDGSLQAPAFWAVGPHSGYFSLVTTDVNGDQLNDVVVGNGPYLKVLIGDGDGNFSGPISSPIPVTPMAIETGDLNGDGVVDLAVEGFYSCSPHSPTCTVLLRALGQGDGTFIPDPPLYLSDESGKGIAIADVNNDSRLDMIGGINVRDACTGGTCGAIVVQLQDENGSMTAPISTDWPTLWGGYGIRASDLTADGVVDLLVGGGVRVVRGDGSGVFHDEGGYSGSPIPGMGAVGDLDEDGFLDVAVAGWNSTLHVYFGRDPSPPTLEILSPMPGSELPIGSSQTILWSASDDVGLDHFDLYFSRHGLVGPFQPLAIGLENTENFEWMVTGPLSDSAILKIVARDLSGNVTVRTTAGLTIVANTAIERSPISGHDRLEVGPNPITGAATIRFALPSSGRASIDVLDIHGRRVARAFEGELEAGAHQVRWEPPRELFRKAGIYFLRFSSPAGTTTRRVVITG
jgi:FG-GAP-like repeat